MSDSKQINIESKTSITPKQIETEEILENNTKDDTGIQQTSGNENLGILSETKQEKSKLFLQTYEIISNDGFILGVSLLGRSHLEENSVCQDFHMFSDLNDGWHLYIVSDGAGSACASDRGSRWNCLITERLIKGLLERNDWKFRKQLPTELEWYQEFYAICRQVKYLIAERVDTLDEPRIPKDFNATLLVMIVTPFGMMTGHIGDGRMGYLDNDNIWHSTMTPHKGDEANQTIFMMNKWDSIFIPSKKMSGVSIPETRVIEERPKAVVVLTDGCENFSWECLQKNEQTGRLEDINVPFSGFWNPCIKMLHDTTEDKRFETFTNFIDSNTDECKLEQDDRTVILGIYNHA